MSGDRFRTTLVLLRMPKGPCTTRSHAYFEEDNILFEVQHTRKEIVFLYKKNLSQGGAVSNVRGTVQNIQGTVSNYGGVVGNAYGQVYNATGAVKVYFIVLVSVCVWSLPCRWCRELAVMNMYCVCDYIHNVRVFLSLTHTNTHTERRRLGSKCNGIRRQLGWFCSQHPHRE